MTIDDLIDEVIDFASGKHEKCMVIMINCITLISDKVPEVGERALEVAVKFWIEESADSTALDKARVQCWDYLNAYSASTNIKDAKYCALRAVICVLYADFKGEDTDETLEFFMKMFELIYKDTDKMINELLLIIEGFKTQIN
ncbi:hypothetical protein [Pseudoalteromonas luteoviolacea]|uniref:Uncharacterized protein n=1 Tax=Pseudoalteromonas luteoviolacea S4060-1 TaxID=1365257 RepID=A0A167P0E0_9GAMM|nr:hypothetical protein [Pseudoalteromonas luteoviolacea]KZN69229.1 hypothetical protein N478_11390 [Pseudoalteromonas luteoviolacea S4060-1]